MSMISEQIDRLRKLAKTFEDSGWAVDGLVNEFRDAADTIEELSAKLAAANMERSTAYYNDGWIPCSERLPEEPKSYEVTIRVLVNGKRTYITDYCLFGERGKWLCVNAVVAWRERNKPYQPKGE